MKYKLNFFTQLSVFLWYNHHSLPIQSPLYPINSHSVHIWNPHHILITSSSNPMKSQEIPRNPLKSTHVCRCQRQNPRTAPQRSSPPRPWRSNRRHGHSWFGIPCPKPQALGKNSLYLYGDGSIPINTIFRGMNIHLPAILMFTRGTRFWHTAI